MTELWAFVVIALVLLFMQTAAAFSQRKKTESECYTNLVSEIVEMGIVDGVATAAAAGVARRRLQYLQMVIGKVDPHSVRGLVSVEVVGTGRVWWQCMTGT